MKVLVGIDGGTQQPAALALASQLAGLPGDELVVAAVRPALQWSEPLSAPVHHAEAEDQALLDAAHDQLDGREARTIVVADDHPARALKRLAGKERPDVLVVGSSHRGRLGRALLGTTGDAVVHGAPCAVVVAPRDFRAGDAPIGRIGIAFDGSRESDAALDFAQDLAERFGASLEVLSVLRLVELAITPPHPYAYAGVLEDSRAQMQELVDSALDRIRPGVQAVGRVLEGAPAATLADAAREMDLLVVGSRGHGVLATVVLGSVTRPLLHDAPCPMVVVPRTAISERGRETPARSHDTVA